MFTQSSKPTTRLYVSVCDYNQSTIITVIPQINVSATINTQDNKMKMLFNEADEMRYHGVWLRHNCRCPLCYDHAAQNSLVRPNHLERNNTIIEKVDINGTL